MTSRARPGTILGIIIVIICISMTVTISAVSAASAVTVTVKDARTKVTVDNALVYLNGAYIGTTSSGTMTLADIKAGTHTVRVTKPDYREVTKKFSYPDESTIKIEIARGALVLLNENAASADAINVVFYPSSTSYSCTDRAKISSPAYLANETLFREDVQKVIRSTYLDLDKVTSTSDPLPSGYEDAFNFYYYYDPSAPGDAFSGCAGTIPESYWNEVTFSDVTVLLYPKYYGIYANTSCQPTGCSQNFGPGRNLMKAPADQLTLIQHESGHAVFQLVDTYCGNTYYYQNDPHANVWSSLESCQADARTNQRDASQCRQIKKTSSIASASCSQNYWQWDPMPDIMANGYKGKFGDASTQRINYVISQVGV